MHKKELSERDICTKFITPAVVKAGWDIQSQIREEVFFTRGRIIVRGKLVTRGKAQRADYILYYKPNIPIALIEAKDNNEPVGGGMQQAIKYAATLDIPFVFSSNGDAFLFQDRTGHAAKTETELTLDAFPTPAKLWESYRDWKGLAPAEEEIVLQDYHEDSTGKEPRYYQQIAINKTIEAIAKGRDRILLVMATGTGKTYTAFQIIWRLWKAGRRKRILFLADRNVLVDQTMVNDFRPFGAAMAKLSTSSKTIEREDGTEVQIPTAIDKKLRRIDTSYEIYLALYQAITGPEERQKLFRELSRDFFDLIVVDECHRGSAAEDSAWREILEYFSSATQIGLTATPKETEYVSNIHYFGKPVYSYSLKEGIRDGFLAPYKVVKVHLDVDIEGYRPKHGETDKYGYEIEDRIYNQKDFDRELVIDERTKRVANKVSEFLKGSGDRFQKTIDTLKRGDFVIGKIGTIGQPFLLPEPFDYTLSANIILVQPNVEVVLPTFLVTFFCSPIAQSALRKQQTDSTHAVFGIKKAREFLIPLPPLPEQHRIVAKVDELMALCDRLEAQLTTTQTESRRLLEAVLYEALNKHQEQE
jgi:type I restriction enzyme R subunit